MKKLVYLLLFLFLVVTGNYLQAQSFKGIPKKLGYAIEKSISFKNPLVIAEYFMGTPYLANRLSKSNPEKLYYSFTDFDCVTFIENVLALYNSNGSNNKFVDNLKNIRYNDSICYETRNHYLSTGLEKLVQLKFLMPINNELNSSVVQKDVKFLSKHVINKNVDKSYLLKIEKSISFKNMYYFSQDKYSEIEDLIKSGDIIAFVSSRNDLDFKHVGFVYIKNNKKHILHASQENNTVCISELSIDKYVVKNQKIKGFQIYRPIL